MSISTTVAFSDNLNQGQGLTEPVRERVMPKTPTSASHPGFPNFLETLSLCRERKMLLINQG